MSNNISMEKEQDAKMNIKTKDKAIYGIVILTVILLCMQGCATTRTHWESSLRVQDGSKNNNKVGVLQDEKLIYNITVTDLGKVNTTVYPGGSPPEMSREPKIFMNVHIRCHNKSNNTVTLITDPIQIIDASNTILRQRTPDNGFEIALKKELNSTQSDNLTVTAIKKNSSDTKTFVPVLLPSGVAVEWQQYYNYTHGEITVILESQNVNDGLVFTSPPLPPLKYNPSTKANQVKIDSTTAAIGIALAALIILYVSQNEGR